MAWAEYKGQRVEYLAHPHEHGDGFSYSIKMSDKKGDTIHLDTKPGTIFSDGEIVALYEYAKLFRARKKE